MGSGLVGVVLVVDDDPSVRLVAVRGLRGLGYAAEEADGGEAALALVRAEPRRYHCCLLDLTMPGPGGGWLREALAEAAPALPVVVMSGVAEAEAREQLAGLPVAGYLPKPFDLDGLASTVRARRGSSARLTAMRTRP